MGFFRPQCITSDGERMFMVGYYPIKHATVDRLQHRVLLLQSQTRPTSFKHASWTVISTVPSILLERQGLGPLLDRLTSGESSCSIDSRQQTFVWITRRPLNKDTSDTSSSLLGIKLSILAETGAWTVIKASRLNGATGGRFAFTNASEPSALLALESGLFVHAQVSGSGDGIVLTALEGSSFVESNRIWSLDAATYGTPRALAYTRGTIYLVGSNKVLTLFPMSTTATDAVTLQEFQESLAPSTARRFRLSSLPDECLNPRLYHLHTTANESSLHFLCVSVYSSTAPRMFTFDGVKLNGPFALRETDSHSNISTFISVKGSAPLTASLDFSIALGDCGTVGTTRSVATGMLDLGKRGIGDPTSTTTTTPSASSSPNSSSDGDAGGQDSNGSSAPGGIAGGIVTVLVILLIVYCRFIRKKHLKAKIDRIMQRSEQGEVVRPNAIWISPSHTVLPPPLPTLPPRPPPPPEHIELDTIPTEEQDLAHIEMQRMQIGPLPAALGRRAAPFVPSSDPVVAESDIPISHIGASAPTPSYRHSLQQLPQASQHQDYHHKHQQKQLPAQHHLQVYAHHRSHESQEVILGEDPHAQPLHVDSASGSSMTCLLLPKSEPYASHLTSFTDHSHNNYLDHPYQHLEHHRTPSTPDTLKKDNAWTEAGSASAAAPAPPPYLVKVTQKLNSPSAPAPLDNPSVDQSESALFAGSRKYT